MGNTFSGNKPKYDTKLKGHEKTISCLAFSPDSRLLASGSEDCTIRLWTREEGCIQMIKGHSGPINAIAFSPNGQTIATGSNDNTLRLWTLGGQCKRLALDHTSPITCLTYSPDGTRIVTGSMDKTIRIWDEYGKCLHALDADNRYVKSIDFSPDSTTFVTTSYDNGKLILWSREGQQLKSIDKSIDNVIECKLKDVKFLTNAHLLFVHGQEKLLEEQGLTRYRDFIERIDTSGKIVGIKVYYRSFHATLTPDKLAFVHFREDRVNYSREGSISIENFAGDSLANFPNSGKSNQSNYSYVDGRYVNFAFSPDGQYLAASVKNNKIYLWDLPSRGVHVQSVDNSASNHNGAAAAAEPANYPSSNAIDSHTHDSSTNDDSASLNTVVISSDISIDSKQLHVNMNALLGSGSYGKVYKGQYQGMHVAVKQLYDVGVIAEKLKDFKREVAINANIRHENCVRFYGACFTSPYSIVMELMTGGSLYDLLRSDKNLPWAVRYRIARDIAHGLMHLHSQDIVHRDIKSLNVMLSDTLRAKLTDFGLGKFKQDLHCKTQLTSCTPAAASDNDQPNVIGTTAWNAPELLHGRKPQHTRASDMYSFGMVLWELASRRLPFEKALSAQQVYDWVKTGEKEEIPADTPAPYAKLINSLWAKPNERPSAMQAATTLTQCNNSKPKTPFKAMMSN